MGDSRNSRERPSDDTPVPRRFGYASLGKRVFDVAFALGALAMATPLIVGILAMLHLSGRHPLIRKSCVGREGRAFELVGFNTAADGTGTIDGLCRFLSRSGLRELPQLWNVVRGDMSLIGPCPMSAEEVRALGAEACGRLAVRPGLTGTWQGVSFGNPERLLELDLDYVRNLSFVRDIAILLGFGAALAH